MSDPIQPPPGYTTEPPTEPGWYRVWKSDFYHGPFRVEEVYMVRPGELCTCLLLNVNACEGWYWGPRVDFP